MTFFNKVVFPAIWVGGLGALVLWVIATTGLIRIAPGFEIIAVFTLVATVMLVWLTVRLQRVGYWGDELVVANYWRKARIPFKQVAAVEGVWWYWRRMVRVRFHSPTPFGSVVYYLPKWAAVRPFLGPPEEELRQIIRSVSAEL